MKKIIIFSSLLLLSLTVFAQTDSIQEAPLTIVEKMPKFPGGDQKMMEFIQKNIHYPQKDKELGIQGTTYITFVVEKDGKLTNVKVLRGIPCGEASDLEAVRVITSMPSWEAGTQNGRAVRVQYNLPIKFTLYKSPVYDCAHAKEIGKQVTDHYNAGVKYSENNEFEKAISEFSEVLNINPTDIDALYNRGIMYIKIGKNDEACKDWNKIKTLGKSDADGLIKKFCK
jgi:TonB family protein